MGNTTTDRRSRLASAVISVCLLSASVSASAPAAAAGPAEVNCLQAALGAQPAFSGVALLRHGGRQHLAAQGSSDAAGAAPRTDTRFNLGSASKMFTAVAVAQLVAQDKLALDAPIGRWVDGLTPAVAAVTLRQLLTHSGGLGNFVVPENLAALQRARTLGQQMALVQDDRPAFEPGSHFRYSNTGFLLLGRAVERAAGMPFADYLRARVFEPAGMTQTSLDPALPLPATPGYTRLPEWTPGPGPGPGSGPGPGPGPRPGPGGPVGPLRPAAEAAHPGSPAGGAYSTAEDLVRFMDALESGKLVANHWVKELTRKHIDATPPGAPRPMHYGLGFGLSPWEGQPGFGHNGGAPGVNAEVMRFTGDDLLIVVLANRDPPVAGQMLARLRQAAQKGNLCG